MNSQLWPLLRGKGFNPHKSFVSNTSSCAVIAGACRRSISHLCRSLSPTKWYFSFKANLAVSVRMIYYHSWPQNDQKTVLVKFPFHYFRQLKFHPSKLRIVVRVSRSIIRDRRRQGLNKCLNKCLPYQELSYWPRSPYVLEQTSFNRDITPSPSIAKERSGWVLNGVYPIHPVSVIKLKNFMRFLRSRPQGNNYIFTCTLSMNSICVSRCYFRPKRLMKLLSVVEKNWLHLETICQTLWQISNVTGLLLWQ